MKKLVAEVYRDHLNRLWPVYVCTNEGGDVDRGVTDTLLDLIQTSIPSDRNLEKWVRLAEAGGYTSPNLSLPDWGVDDINVWLVAPMAEPGCVCISNENTGDYSVDEGLPQQFTYEQFNVALAHWRAFRDRISQEGKEALVGQRFEAVFPSCSPSTNVS